MPDPSNPLNWDRYAYGLNSPSRYTDPSGHSVCDIVGADPECKELHIQKHPEPSKPPVNPSTDLLSQLNDDKSDDKDDDLPFDTSLGGNLDNEEHDLGFKENPSHERPSVAALIAMGIPLTAAIVLVETGLTYMEIQIGLVTLAQPELAPATIPLELLVTGASLALIDVDIAYWSYNLPGCFYSRR